MSMIRDEVRDAAGNLIKIREYPAPPSFERVPERVTETQFMIAARRKDMVTWDEVDAYLGSGAIPAFVVAALAPLPEDQRREAQAKIKGSSTFHRADPVFALLIAGGAATAAQVDDLFRLAATLE
jgi:hypothetical protein